MRKKSPFIPVLRTIPANDFLRAAALALFSVLIWCTIYNRWTAGSWQIPVAYLEDPQKGDVIGFLAEFKVAGEGHILPLGFSNIPELGAPHVGNWDDFPIPEKPLVIFIGVLSRFVGLFAAANITAMLGHVLAAVSFYAAARLLRGAWTWAFAGALVFAFARYGFAHELHHLPVLYFWHVPLDLVVISWLLDNAGLKWGDGRLIFMLIIGFLTGVQNIYYFYLFAQFVLMAGLIQCWRNGWRAALPAAAVLGISGAAFGLMNANTFFYHLAYGENPDAVVRSFKWLEIYGLKLVDMVMPPPDHRVSFLASWSTGHIEDSILSPGEYPPAAYLGVLGLAAVGWLTLASIRRLLNGERLPIEAWLILWTLLYADVGGVNGVLGALGFQFVRATTRYSIVVLCIALMYAVARLSALHSGRRPFWIPVAAIAAVALALWDQTPPPVSDQNLQALAADVAADRTFTEKMEARVGPNAMIFQLPIMDYPETPLPGIGSYDHFRPFLYSQHLRYSFGSDKGRPRERWQHELAAYSFNEVVQRLENYGFAAIYLNRSAFPDKGEGLIKSLQQMGRTEMITNDRDLVCVFLKPSTQPMMPDAYQ